MKQRVGTRECDKQVAQHNMSDVEICDFLRSETVNAEILDMK